MNIFYVLTLQYFAQIVFSKTNFSSDISSAFVSSSGLQPGGCDHRVSRLPFF